MVLPFGLGSNGQHYTATQTNSNSTTTGSTRSTFTPTAPPGAFLMHGQTNVSTTVPVIPSPYIDFIVVNGDDRYMIRCQRKAVLENSIELAKLIHAGPNSGRKGDNHFQISNVDKKDFELVVRYLENKFIKCSDHLHILRILELADRFKCPDLIIHCIRELDLQLTSATVIDVFRSLWFYQNMMQRHQQQANANDVVTSQNSVTRKKQKRKTNNAAVNISNRLVANPNPFTAEEFAVALLYNTFQLIDMHAELVLTMDKMTELRFEELEMIAKRDSLQLNTETALYNCLADWSMAECRRKDIDPNEENRRRALGALCYAPRYLLMTPGDFKRCCARVELLDAGEKALILESLEGKRPKNITSEQAEWLEKFRTPRPEFANMPIHLSDRSNMKNYPKRMRRAEKEANDGDGCANNFGLNCLAVFACIFD